MQQTIERIASPRGFFYDPSCVLYLPLWRLDGSSFMSKDHYGHLCTVTGASWRPQGHYLDGIDDWISVLHHSALNLGTSDFSILVCFKSPTISNTQELITKSGAAGQAPTVDSYDFYLLSSYLRLWICNGNVGNAEGSNNTLLNKNTWYAAGITLDRDGNATFYLNGAADGTLDISATAGDISNSDNVAIGRRIYTPTSYFLVGNISEILCLPKLLSPIENLNYYLDAKRRMPWL